jgi:CRP-like cAMP-binding protein
MSATVSSDASTLIALFNKLVPLNALRPESQVELARKATRHRYASDALLFRIGDPLSHAVYLISGEIQLEDAKGRALAKLSGGEAAAAHRLAHQAPRKVNARCLGDVEVLHVDAGLLDVMLTWDQTGSFEVQELGAGSGQTEDDWMARLLQMRTFQLVPPENLQGMFMRMQEVHCKPGDVVIKQNAEGDYFYVILTGRFGVSREQSSNVGAKPVRLAELGPGACFGEEALISEAPRNATVTALTSARLMRLSKSDFRALLNEPLARRMTYARAREMVSSGQACWLDVRLASEFGRDHLDGASNLPLYLLRARLDSLDKALSYIAVCDTGRRSAVAVFIMMQKGYDAFVLEGGLPPSANR